MTQPITQSIEDGNPLQHFYRRGRKAFVPLLSSEFARACNVNRPVAGRFLSEKVREGILKTERPYGGDSVIYMLTPRGQSIAKREIGV